LERRRKKINKPVRSPCDSIDTSPMIAEPCNRRTWNTNVKNDYFASVHRNGGKIIGILFVPGETQEWSVRWILVDDGTVLQMSAKEEQVQDRAAYTTK